MTPDDQTWLRQLKLGDKEAKDKLWLFLDECRLRYIKQHPDFAYYDEETTKEAADKAYEKIMSKGLTQYKGKGSFKGYCRQIFVNTQYPLQEKLGKQRSRTQPLTETEQIQNDSDPTATYEMMMTRLKPCLDKLNSRQQEVFELLLARQGRIASAAQLGIKENHFSVLSHRVRYTLKTCLEQRGFASADEFASF